VAGRDAQLISSMGLRGSPDSVKYGCQVRLMGVGASVVAS
jgi:hypothetical protein